MPHFLSTLRATIVTAAILGTCAGAALLAHAQSDEGGSRVRVVPIAAPEVDSGIALAASNANAVSTPSAARAWGGPRTGSEATLSDRVADYRIAATLDPVKHTVTGREQLTWRNRSSQSVRSVYLHLYMNGFEHAGTTFFTEQRRRSGDGRPVRDVKDGEWGHIALNTVTQGGARVDVSFIHPDRGPIADHTVVRLDLPAPVAGGASTTLDIDFLTQLPRLISRTGYFGSFHLVGQWFPKIGVLELPGERGATAPRWNVHEFHANSEFYADFGAYDVTIRTPAGYTVGATGEQQGEPVVDGGWVTRRFVQGDVHDFAFTADSRTATPLTGTWTGPGSPTVKLTVLYPPEFASSAAPALEAAKKSLSYFSTTLGPYPYETVTIVLPPHNADEAAGMEYPTFFTAESYRDVRPDTLNRYLLDGVTIHEFGHGYFYGILASNEFEEPVLDEGMNQFWDARMVRAIGYPIHIATPLMQKLGLGVVAKPFDIERMAAPREEPADPPGQNAWDRLQGIGSVYTRSSTVMRDLEQRIGSAAMERAMKAYYQRWRFRHPSVADLRESLAEASGQRAVVEAIFAQQIYAITKIDDRIDTLFSVEQLPGPGTRQVGKVWKEISADDLESSIDDARTAWRKQHPELKDKPGLGPFPYETAVTLRRRGTPVPQTLVVHFADGTSETASWDGPEQWKRFTWTRPARAVSAELDPRHLHYLDANKLDDSRTIKPDTRASRRWSADLAALFQLLATLLTTV
jgi:hypothetical protein